MDVRGLIPLVQLVFSKVFVKALLGIAILIVIAGSLPWIKNIYDRIFPRPELRITESSPSQDTQVENECLCQRVAVVENRGNSTANEVYVTASVPGGRITKYEVFANHPYTVHPNTDISRGYLVLALDRLSPGARIKVYLWGSRFEHMPDSRMFAAVYDAGSAPSTGEPSSEEQIRDFVDTILANFEESFAWIADNVIGPNDISIPVPQVPSHLVISAITLAVLAWLFLDPVLAALVHGGLASGMCWLVIPPTVIPSICMTLCIIPFNLYLGVKTASGWKLSREDSWVLTLSVLFVFFALADAFGVRMVAHSVTHCITVGYLATMLSLELL